MIYAILRSLPAGFQTHQSLVLENLASRHQVQVLKRVGMSGIDARRRSHATKFQSTSEELRRVALGG